MSAFLKSVWNNHSYKISFALGCLSALSMAPASWWFVLFVTLPLFFAKLCRAGHPKRAFGISWLFAFGYFLCSLSWIGSALLVEGNGYRWAYPLAVSGIPFLLAFFWGLAGWIFHITKSDHSTLRWINFTVMFSLTELARGYLFTGFPWNLFGYSWINHLEILQITHVISIYGLTALTWGWASSLYFIARKGKMRALPALALGSVIACFIYGQQRLSSAKDFEGSIAIKIVPGDIDQAVRWQGDQIFNHVMRYIERSTHRDANHNTPTLIVWPETALLDSYYQDAAINGYLRDMLASYPAGATLITGALRQSADGSGAVYNSLLEIDQNGAVSNIYNKSHLVPFGEYIPFQAYIPLTPVNNFSGFMRGDGAQIFTSALGVTYAPAICYEIIFPHSLLPRGSTKPDYIINVTNDAWYAGSAGPAQHFAQVKVRAIEYGVPIIRSANHGVSDVVDKYGRKKSTL